VLKRLALNRTIAWRIGIAACDFCAVLFALTAVLWLRFDNDPIDEILNDYFFDHLSTLLVFAAFYVLVLYIFRMYHHAWRFAGMEAVRSLLGASAVGLCGMVVMNSLIAVDMLPSTVMMMWWLMSTLAIGGLRVLIRIGFRIYYDKLKSSRMPSEKLAPTRAIIVGAAEYGAGILKSVANTHSLRNYEIIGVLDDRADKTGLFYGGVRVLGTTELLQGFLEGQEVDEVIFPLSDESDGSVIRRHVLECRKRKVMVKVIPNLVEMLMKPMPVRLEDIRIEDLLRRPMRSLDVRAFGGYLAGKRVAVTGAGGSIGSEICRQIAQLNPAELVLIGHGENSIFKIEQELKRAYPELAANIFPIIASIKNASRMDRIFTRFKPEVVFHAAAHKHLPLMESNICEAAHNNVIGTYNVVQACVKHGVERMVQISTDKAADPACVMGATKWLCEAVVKSTAQDNDKTNFVCVRFGNVLGSRGSVIPVFNDQIRKGGPVTVTHPEMTRYFMTIPEAVRLVIQAGGAGQNGYVYLLDMGKPVKILDLAEDMIRLHGYEPNVDIPIIYTGVRPGEKLHEQLASSHEQVMPSENEGLNVVKPTHVMTQKEINQLIAKLDRCVKELDGGGVISIFQEIIPGYADTARAAFTRLVS